MLLLRSVQSKQLFSTRHSRSRRTRQPPLALIKQLEVTMTPDNFTAFVIGLAGVGVAGFVAWTVGMIIRARADIAALKLHVSEYYMKKDDLGEMKRDVRELRHVVFEIAGKLGIPVRQE